MHTSRQRPPPNTKNFVDIALPAHHTTSFITCTAKCSFYYITTTTITLLFFYCLLFTERSCLIVSDKYNYKHFTLEIWHCARPYNYVNSVNSTECVNSFIRLRSTQQIQRSRLRLQFVPVHVLESFTIISLSGMEYGSF